MSRGFPSHPRGAPSSRGSGQRRTGIIRGRGRGVRWPLDDRERWTSFIERHSRFDGDGRSKESHYGRMSQVFPFQVQRDSSEHVSIQEEFASPLPPYDPFMYIKPATTWKKFVLLMWKNFVLQCRRPFPTFLEIIIIPVLMTALLLALRSIMAPEKMEARRYTPFCPVEMPLICDTLPGDVEHHGGSVMHLKKFSLAYSPTGNSEIDRSMGFFKFIFGNVNSYASEDLIEEHLLTSNEANSTWAAIVFDYKLKDGTELPDGTEVKIRFPGELKTSNANSELSDWATNSLFPLVSFPGPRDPDMNFGSEPAYYEEGFLALQTMLTYFLIYGQLGWTTPDDFTTKVNDLEPLAPTMKMQRFPHADWIEDPVKVFMAALVGLVMTCAFYYTFTRIVTVIMIEKERQLKESMKLMGLPNWLHWTAWFCKSFIFLSIGAVLIVILFKVPCKNKYSVLTYTNPILIYLFLLLYICSLITFAFACSTFFSKANTAAFISQLLYLATYIPHMLRQKDYATMHLVTKMGISLGMNSAMAFGFNVMLIFEGTHAGIQWRDLFRTGTPDNNMTLGHVMLMLLVDTFLYLCIALYVEAVFPGEYGVPQPWNYLFTSTYWRGRPRNKSAAGPPDPAAATPTVDPEYFETEPVAEPGVQIKNLRKVFANKVAVRNLTMNMYQDQITVLLGHNGAGKTTTMSMLTGLIPPTSGTATIEGHDIRTDLVGARSSLGLCPQHNVLFDDLTVKEHLMFFTQLKGLDEEDVYIEVDRYIKQMDLVFKADDKSSTLSGGMKRRLCVGIAMCGFSQVVMLDEPTAGMDPLARRAIWELIQKQKGGRTILLTTHFMDEADVLGDRIAIMAGGELQCCGSSFFLKKQYGAGYRLIVVKTKGCDPDLVTRMLQSHIPSIEIQSNVGSELTYLLDDDDADYFEAMLKHLEDHSGPLGVRSYGISLTTLEEVFMKVGADHGQEELYDIGEKPKRKSRSKKKKKRKSETGGGEMASKRRTGAAETKLTMDKHEQLLSGRKLVRNQFWAMCAKRILSLRRNWIWLLFQLLVPIAFLILGFFRTKTLKGTGDLPKLAFSLKPYDHPITLIENAAEGRTKEVHDIYVELLTKGPNGRTEHVDSIPDVLMHYTETIPSKLKRRYIVGVSFRGVEQSEGAGSGRRPDVDILAWFNTEPYHSAPLALGLALNSVYKYMLKKQIHFVNHPLPFNADAKIKRLSGRKNIAFLVPFYLTFGLACVSGVYLLFYVRERVCKSKHLQLVSGVKIYVFWLCAFLCDLAMFVFVSLGIIITLTCFQENGFKTAGDLGRFSLVLFYYVVALLPLIYVASFWFQVPSTAMGRLTLLFLLIGIIGFMVLHLIGPMFPNVVDALHWMLLIEPHYALATGIRNIYTTYAINKVCTDYVKICTEQNAALMDESHCWAMVCKATAKCCEHRRHYFQWKATGIGRNMLYSFGLGTTLSVLLLLKEYKCFSLDRRRNAPPASVHHDEDSDVAEEERKIRATSVTQLQRDYSVVLVDLSKSYKKCHKKKRVIAVDGVSLGIKKFECFGLLGVNGAGKTTTFQMITGDVKITGGDAWIDGFNVQTQLGKVHQSIGYCPQFDALLDDLTVRETLVIFALLRGVPRHECANLTEKLAVDFDFSRHLDKQIKKLSGGTKRKVSTAVSMIGDPPVVFLDEPTTGMDPATKRHLWDVLCRVRDSGKCIVLTSHSMEECEALCTRLVIMVSGNFKCLGSIQHLKNKFAAGYTLTIKIKQQHQEQEQEQQPQQLDDDDERSSTQEIEDFVIKNFPKAKLREKFQDMVTYSIVDATVSWSQMFGILQHAKHELSMEDYSLGQSSLEQVFLSFTKT